MIWNTDPLTMQKTRRIWGFQGGEDSSWGLLSCNAV